MRHNLTYYPFLQVLFFAHINHRFSFVLTLPCFHTRLSSALNILVHGVHVHIYVSACMHLILPCLHTRLSSAPHILDSDRHRFYDALRACPRACMHACTCTLDAYMYGVPCFMLYIIIFLHLFFFYSPMVYLVYTLFIYVYIRIYFIRLALRPPACYVRSSLRAEGYIFGRALSCCAARAFPRRGGGALYNCKI